MVEFSIRYLFFSWSWYQVFLMSSRQVPQEKYRCFHSETFIHITVMAHKSPVKQYKWKYCQSINYMDWTTPLGLILMCLLWCNSTALHRVTPDWHQCLEMGQNQNLTFESLWISGRWVRLESLDEGRNLGFWLWGRSALFSSFSSYVARRSALQSRLVGISQKELASWDIHRLGPKSHEISS